MTLNLLFFTITLKKRELTLEEVLHNQVAENLYEENKRKINSYMSQLLIYIFTILKEGGMKMIISVKKKKEVLVDR
ncbi:MAG: YrzI family small protein [Bacillota bacterium]